MSIIFAGVESSALWLIPACLGMTLCFILLSYLVGRVLPDHWLLVGPAPWLQSLLVGFFLEVCVLRLPYRYEYPEDPAYIAVGLLALFGLYRCWRENPTSQWARRLRSADWRHVALTGVKYALIFLPGFAILFAPLVFSHALVWQNNGPDYDGYLISTSYLADHHTYADMIRGFMDSTGSSHWWSAEKQAWNLPDIRITVAIEFIARALRYGHVVQTILIMKLFHAPLWLAFHCLCVYAFIVGPLVAFEFGLRRQLSYGLLLAGITIIFGSQSYILLMYEGIGSQLILTPIMLFFTLNWRTILLERKTLGQNAFLGIILSGLISTFGETIQILAIFGVICLTVAWFDSDETQRPKKQVFVDILQIIGLTALIEPTIALDFLFWTVRRMNEHFAGGALHGPWSMTSVLFSIPSVTISPPVSRLLISLQYFPRILEVCLIIAAGIFAWRRRGPAGADLLIVGVALLLFAIVGDTYVMWKIAVILQPLAVLTVLCLLPSRIFALRVPSLVGFYAVIVFCWSAYLIGMYWRHAQPMHLDQFAIDDHLTHGRSVAIVTPSADRVYMRLGATGLDYWSNSVSRPLGMKANFRINQLETLPIALYFDCDAEGPARCAAIRHKIGGSVPERMLVPLKTQISALLETDGSVDQSRLHTFIADQFGVPAH